MRRRQLEKYMQIVPCTSCHGSRLNSQARAVRLTTANPNWPVQRNQPAETAELARTRRG